MRLELGVGHGLPDHAPVRGLRRVDPLGEERGPHRLGRAHLARQPVGAARVGDEPDAREGLDEVGALGGDHHVGGEREVGAGPRGRPVHGGDGRHGAVEDRLEHRHVLVAQRALEVDVGGVRPVAQILARAERSAPPREDHHAGALAGLAHRMGDLGPHLGVERVHDVGAVERDRRHAGRVLHRDRVVVHAVPPCERRP